MCLAPNQINVYARIVCFTKDCEIQFLTFNCLLEVKYENHTKFLSFGMLMLIRSDMISGGTKIIIFFIIFLIL